MPRHASGRPAKANKDNVAKAVREIRAAGGRVTVAAVRERVGGNPSRVSVLINEVLLKETAEGLAERIPYPLLQEAWTGLLKAYGALVKDADVEWDTKESTMQTECDAAQSMAAKSSQALEAAQADIQRLKKTIDEQEGALIDFRRAHATIQDELQKAKVDSAEQKVIIARAEGEAHRYRERFSGAEQRVAELTSQLEAANASLEAAGRERATERTQFEQRLRLAESGQAEAEDAATLATEGLANALRRINELEGKISDLSKAGHFLEESLSKSRNNEHALDRELSEIRGELKAGQARVTELHHEIQERSCREVDLKAQILQLQDRIKVHKKAADELTDKGGS